MNTARLLTAAAAVTLIALPLGSFAQTQSRTMIPGGSGPYVGAGGSWNQVDEGALDDDAAGFKLYGGWQFNPVLGAELSYAWFDEFESGGVDLDAEGFGLAATAGYPITPMITPYAKVGRFWSDTDSSLGDRSLKIDNHDLFYGVGVKVPFNDTFAMRVEAERYELSQSDLDSLSVNAEMNF